MRNLKYFALFTVVAVYSSCSNEEGTLSLSGLYTETAPVSGRSQLHFIDGNTVVKIEPDGTTEDEFNYELVDGVIKLIPIWDPSYSTEHEIKIESESRFEIEDLYYSNGIVEATYMTFEK